MRLAGPSGSGVEQVTKKSRYLHLQTSPVSSPQESRGKHMNSSYYSSSGTNTNRQPQQPPAGPSGQFRLQPWFHGPDSNNLRVYTGFGSPPPPAAATTTSSISSTAGSQRGAHQQLQPGGNILAPSASSTGSPISYLQHQGSATSTSNIAASSHTSSLTSPILQAQRQPGGGGRSSFTSSSPGDQGAGSGLFTTSSAIKSSNSPAVASKTMVNASGSGAPPLMGFSAGGGSVSSTNNKTSFNPAPQALQPSAMGSSATSSASQYSPHLQRGSPNAAVRFGGSPDTLATYRTGTGTNHGAKRGSSNKKTPDYTLGPPREITKRPEGEAAPPSSRSGVRAPHRLMVDLGADPDTYGDYMDRLPEPVNTFQTKPDQEHEAVGFETNMLGGVEHTRLPGHPTTNMFPGMDVTIGMEGGSPSASAAAARERERRRELRAATSGDGGGAAGSTPAEFEQTILPSGAGVVVAPSGSVPQHFGGNASRASSGAGASFAQQNFYSSSSLPLPGDQLPASSSSYASYDQATPASSSSAGAAAGASGVTVPPQAPASVASAMPEKSIFNLPGLSMPNGLSLNGASLTGALDLVGGGTSGGPGERVHGSGASSAGSSDSSIPMIINSARGPNLNTLDGWINNQNLGRIETVDQAIIDRVKRVAINRPLRRDFTDFAQELREVFPQETLDKIFQRTGRSSGGGGSSSSSISTQDIKKFAGGGLNHEFIMTGMGAQGKLLVKVIAVRQEMPGASQGEAVETEYLRLCCPELPSDANVCFPIASYRGVIEQTNSSTSSSSKRAGRNSRGEQKVVDPLAPKYYDIVVLNFVENCINIRDLVSAFDKAPGEVQQEVMGHMKNLIGFQIPRLFHRFYLRHRRKMGDGKADNILINRQGNLYIVDIGSTFNAVIRPCDKGEFLRSLQASHQESPVNLLKQAFEHYFAHPPDHDTVDIESGFPIMPHRGYNADMVQELEVYLNQKGGLLRALPKNNGVLRAGVQLNVPSLGAGLGIPPPPSSAAPTGGSGHRSSVSSGGSGSTSFSGVQLQTPANMPTIGAPGGFTFSAT
ncbi:unnamed protein product [Amoebophrya sp. A120]|nr:unnamed protein product [Amoebophrya sp. A120]|eukprot:GSA120T00017971001.1